MALNRLVFRVHALQRMFERKISEEDVLKTLKWGETIAEYPDDKPYPSRLLLGWVGERPLHVLVAENKDQAETIVVTVYEPDLETWEPDFKKRRR